MSFNHVPSSTIPLSPLSVLSHIGTTPNNNNQTHTLSSPYKLRQRLKMKAKSSPPHHHHHHSARTRRPGRIRHPVRDPDGALPAPVGLPHERGVADDGVDDLDKGLADVVARLGADLAEAAGAVGGGQGAALVGGHGPRPVRLGAHQVQRHARDSVHLDLVEPRLHAGERGPRRRVVHQDDAVRAAVVGRRERAEALLAGLGVAGGGRCLVIRFFCFFLTLGVCFFWGSCVYVWG